MTEKFKKALQEMQEATQKVLEICRWEEYDPNKPTPCLDTDALEDALDEEKEARMKYFTLLWQRRGWTQEKIDEEIKRLGSK